LAAENRPRAPAIAAQDFQATIIDESGNPIADREIVLTGFGFHNDLGPLQGDRDTIAERWQTNPRGGIVMRTDKLGRFTIAGKELFPYATPQVSVLAIDIEGYRGALASVVHDSPSTELMFAMRPLREVQMKFDRSHLPSGLSDAVSELQYLLGPNELSAIANMNHSKLDLPVRLHLPPGSYSVLPIHQLVEQESISFEIPVEVPTEQPFLNIELALKASAISKLIGKKPPELRDLVGWLDGDQVTLEELRGKVVILNFWAYWCGPCIEHMKSLSALHDKLAKEGLEIIAIHDGSIPSMELLKREMESIQARAWNGRELPFRVALSGKSLEPLKESEQQVFSSSATTDYGINQYPTMLVIDRAGNVVECLRLASDSEVEERITRLLREK
jgi:thiol-disulfide isomerase/thioredoxin